MKVWPSDILVLVDTSKDRSVLLGDGEPDKDFPALDRNKNLKGFNLTEYCLCEADDDFPVPGPPPATEDEDEMEAEDIGFDSNSVSQK